MPENDKKIPVVGISGGNTDSKSVAAMVAQVRANGAIPMVFANHGKRDAARDIGKIDGLIIMGNDDDIDPKRYKDAYPEGDPRRDIHPKTVIPKDPEKLAAYEARAAYEEQLIKLSIEHNMPTLGVCAGMQSINVLHGGGLLQHIPDLVGNDNHAQNIAGIPAFSPVIPVDITAGSNVAKATKANLLYTASVPPPEGMVVIDENSFHHQAIDPDMVGNGLKIVAFSDQFTNVNGEQRRLPEAIEPDPNGPLKDWPMRAVQWHPEFGASAASANLIAATVNDAALNPRTATRDRRNDKVAALAENIISAKKPAPTASEYQTRVTPPSSGRSDSSRAR